MTTPIIYVKSLKKTYKIYRNHKGYLGALRNLFNRQYEPIHAVDDISFEIQKGELVGYIGPTVPGNPPPSKC